MRIGYYAHHHGSGHCRQADKLAALLPFELRQQMTVFSSLPTDGYRFSTITNEQIVRLSTEDQLPEDVLSGRAGEYWQPSSLHYSPVGNRHVQTRSWQLLEQIRQRQIDLMIIDVSVEVAMLCRTASVPYLYVRLAGERDDEPHLNAFAGALGLLAPYPRQLEAATTPDWVRQKTLYLDFMPNKTDKRLTFPDFIDKLIALTTNGDIHKRLYLRLDYDNKSAKDNNHKDDNNKDHIVTVIKGYGGHDAIDAKLPELRCALPKALIVSLGPINDEVRDCVDIAAHVDDVSPFIAYSDLLLMACGLNGIAQAYNYATPLVVLPDERPHREQEVMAEALIEQGRALSWAQFITQTSNLSSQDRLSFLSINNDSISNETINNEKAALTDIQPSMAAQNFMDSIADYVSVKAWFQEWLLPQLGLRPEK